MWFTDLLLSLTLVGMIVLFCYETQLITIAILQIQTFARKTIGVKIIHGKICQNHENRIFQNWLKSLENTLICNLRIQRTNNQCKQQIWRQVWILGEHFFFLCILRVTCQAWRFTLVLNGWNSPTINSHDVISRVFSSKLQQIHIISVSLHFLCFILKICQNAAGIGMFASISRIFWNLISGRFLPIGPNGRF